MRKHVLIAAVLFAVCGVFARDFEFFNVSGNTVEIRSVTVFDTATGKTVRSSCEQLPFKLKNSDQKTISVAFKQTPDTNQITVGIRCKGRDYPKVYTFTGSASTVIIAPLDVTDENTLDEDD